MNSKYLTICLITFFILSCSPEKNKDFTILKGSISGGLVETVKLEKKGYSNNFKEVDLSISNNQTFQENLEITSGYYSLKIGSKNINIYLESNFDLTLNIDLEKNIIKFDGKGEIENNYLKKKDSLQKETFYFDNYKYHAKLTENRFLQINDSIRNLYLDLLQKSISNNQKFEELERKSILLDNVYNLMGFEISKRLLTEHKDFKVSGSFPNPEETFDFNDESFLDIPLFIPLIANNPYYFLKNKINLDTSTEKLKCLNCDLYLEHLNNLESFLNNQKIINETSFLISKWWLGKTQNFDGFYESFKAINSNQEYLEFVRNIYNNLNTKRLESFLSHEFLKDTKGELISLNEFKGKILYLDFWSSSCAPCIREFTYLNEMLVNNQGENFEVIGINIRDTEERWKKTIRAHDLNGIQLSLANDSKFLERIGISSIPRYMVIDDAGDIVDYNAEAPSDFNVKKHIKELIKN